jgi:hypothetical protein
MIFMKSFTNFEICSFLKKFIFITGIFLILSGSATLLYAQVEDDTTRVEREGPELPEEIRHNNFLHTPYQMDFSESEMNRYRISDYDNMYGFYRRMQYQSPQQVMMTMQASHERYGSDWENELNAQLIAILQATFKEQNSLLQMLSRIAPFLGFGFFEPYEVPVVPRNEDPDRVYIEE